MGRSQVLYNRTKGRFRNRGGAGRGNDSGGRGHGRGDEDGNANKNSHHRPNPNTVNASLAQRSQQEFGPGRKDHAAAAATTRNDTTGIGKRNKASRYDESTMMLLADASPAYYHYGAASAEFDDRNHLHDAGGILEAGGSINIPSLATTLQTTLSTSCRLNLPAHVVALALNKNAANDNDGHDYIDFTATTEQRRKNMISAKDDDDDDAQSVTIAGTRNRATATSEGVEVGPSRRHQHQHQEKQKVSPPPRPQVVQEEDENDGDNASTDDSKYNSDNKYYVAEASQRGQGKEIILRTSTMRKTERPSLVAPTERGGEEEESILEDWLDEAMQSGDADSTAQVPPVRTVQHKSSSPTQRYPKAAGVGVGGGPGKYSRQDVVSSSTSISSITRQSADSVVTSEEGDDQFYDGESYDVFSLDSGGQMFEDSVAVANSPGRQHQQQHQPSGYGRRKDVVRDYVIQSGQHPQGQGNSALGRGHKVVATFTPANTRGGTRPLPDEGEDLDEWLDSVIE